MKKRIRINGKVYEAVDPYKLNSSNTDDDSSKIRNIAKKVNDLGELNRRSADTAFDIAYKLIQMLRSSNYGYNKENLRKALRALDQAAGSSRNYRK